MVCYHERHVSSRPSYCHQCGMRITHILYGTTPICGTCEENNSIVIEPDTKFMGMYRSLLGRAQARAFYDIVRAYVCQEIIANTTNISNACDRCLRYTIPWCWRGRMLCEQCYTEVKVYVGKCIQCYSLVSELELTKNSDTKKYIKTLLCAYI